jgi:hypothetical protein
MNIRGLYLLPTSHFRLLTFPKLTLDTFYLYVYNYRSCNRETSVVNILNRICSLKTKQVTLKGRFTLFRGDKGCGHPIYFSDKVDFFDPFLALTRSVDGILF